MKFKASSVNAVDAALAWSSVGLHLHSNYLWQQENYFTIDRQNFDLFYGLGLRLIMINSGDDKNKTKFVPRAPIGINYKLHNTNLQFFAELALNLTPRSDVDINAGIGVRFYF